MRQKKNLLSLLFSIAVSVATVQTANAQSITAFVTSSGIAPVPAFKLGKPAAMFFFDGNFITTKTFSLEASPDFGINMTNGQGWFGDTWLSANQKLDSAGRWTASAGINWSIIFATQPNGSTRSVPYPTERLRLRFVMDPKNTFDVESWYANAVPAKDGIKGEYSSFQYTRTQPLYPFSISATVNIFHLGYSDGTKGFANLLGASASHRSGIFISCQFLNNFNAANVRPANNFSIGFTRKI